MTDGARLVQIPTIGDVLILDEPWTFHVVNESRNTSLVDYLGVPKVSGYFPLGSHPKDRFEPKPSTLNATLPAGAELKVVRIYIRQHKEEYDSVTFFWKPKGTGGGVPQHFMKGKPKGVRFFAKLRDVNRMVVRSDDWTARDEKPEDTRTRTILLED